MSGDTATSTVAQGVTLRDEFALRLMETLLPMLLDNAPLDKVDAEDIHEAAVISAYDLTDRMLRVREAA